MKFSSIASPAENTGFKSPTADAEKVMSDTPKSPSAGMDVVKHGSEIWSALRMGERPVDTHLRCGFGVYCLGFGVADGADASRHALAF